MGLLPGKYHSPENTWMRFSSGSFRMGVTNCTPRSAACRWKAMRSGVRSAMCCQCATDSCPSSMSRTCDCSPSGSEGCTTAKMVLSGSVSLLEGIHWPMRCAKVMETSLPPALPGRRFS